MRFKRLLVLLFKAIGVLLLGIFVALCGIYLYLANQTGTPAVNHPFFIQLNKRPLVIAHRGGAGSFPENTLYAFEQSWKLGIDVLETDVRETADGKLVLLHDRTVNRTTDGEGNISEMTLETAKNLNAGYKFSTDGGQNFPLRDQKITIPTLEEIFTALPQAKFNIEMKNESETIAASLCETIRKYKMTEKVVAASFSQSNLDKFRRLCPEVATSASTSEVTKFLTYYKTGLGENFSPQMSALQVPLRLGAIEVVSKEFVETARKLNLQVHVWTINKPEDMQKLIELGVDGIMTDYPDRLLEVVGKMPKTNQ
jgi:glycerophosphoryl diester phosphodiesterase